MLRKRIIPSLLLKGDGFVKTKSFKSPSYIGDPINSIKIFNDKQVDEIFIFDIEASKNKQPPNYELLEALSAEAFIPLGYGGGLNSMEEISKIFSLGFEKVVLNHVALQNLALVRQASEQFGAQSIVGMVDIKKSLFGKYRVYDHVAGKLMDRDPFVYIDQLVEAGAGEICLQFVEKDGTFSGYDLPTIQGLADKIPVPLVVAGGAKDLSDIDAAFKVGASGASAGALFVFYGPHRAVLINYPLDSDIERFIHNR